MKSIKIVVGVVLGFVTVCYAGQFVWTLMQSVRVWALTGDWVLGLWDTAASFVPLGVAACFTIWTFQSAFRKRVCDDSPSNAPDD